MKSIVRISRLLILIGLVLTACHREPATQSRTAPGSDRAAPAARSADEAPAQSAQLTCAPPRRVCTGCTGAPICAIRCPECPPPAAPAADDGPAKTAALTCTLPQRACVSCSGEPYCANRCFECAPPAAPPTGDAPATLALGPAGETCGDGLHAVL